MKGDLNVWSLMTVERGLAMRILVGFLAGVLVGITIQTTGAQTPPNQPAVRLNHVAISVKDLPDALKFYGEKLGFREVVRNPNGQSAYIQVSRDTFLELQQANEQRPVGLNHWGLEVQDIKSAVATFRQRGLMVSEPGAPSAFTGGILANISEPTYGRIELAEQPPDGKLRKASESWKP
jgi:catechol 2,3-dioxygenase-like lactoylglutathione lyase family enzyme